LVDFSKIKVTSLDNLTNTTNNILKRNTVKINENNKYIPKKYWDESCERLFRLRSASRHKYYKTKLLSDAKIVFENNKILNNYFYTVRKENMNKLANDLTNPKSMKEMCQTIKSLKSHKLINPTSRQLSDSDYIAFLHQISSAPGTAECIEMDFPSFNIQTINRTYFSASELTKFVKHRTPIPEKV